jgi:transcriptional regulator with XRE-family HTH domain
MFGENLQEIWDSLPEERKKRIDTRFVEMEAEYLTLQELRQSFQKTQTDVANALNVRQVTISQLEHRSDPRVSTLYDFITALGGDLEMVVRFSDRPPVILKGFGNIDVSGIEHRPA